MEGNESEGKKRKRSKKEEEDTLMTYDQLVALSKYLKKSPILTKNGRNKMIVLFSLTWVIEYQAISGAIEFNPRNSFYSLQERVAIAVEHRLELIDWSRSNITELTADALSKVAFVKSLYLDWNSLTMLPPEIVQLKNLCKLNLASNKLVNIPEEIGWLSIIGNIF